MKNILLILTMLFSVSSFASKFTEHKLVISSEENFECRDLATEKLRLTQKLNEDLDTMCTDVIFGVRYSGTEYQSYRFKLDVYCKERNYSDILSVSLYKSCLQSSDINCVKLKSSLDKIKKTKYETKSISRYVYACDDRGNFLNK